MVRAQKVPNEMIVPVREERVGELETLIETRMKIKKEIHAILKKAMNKEVAKSREYYNRGMYVTEYELGELVYVFRPPRSTDIRSKKFISKWIG